MCADKSVLFNMKRNDTVGRHAVASQTLKPGEKIFSETPFAYGPKSESLPVCLGCYVPVDGSILCSKCGWPVCNPNCENNPAHKNAECEVFSQAKVYFPPIDDMTSTCLQYECITPLRVLIAKEKDPKRWEEEVKDMESHNAERKEDEIWKFNQVNVVDYLRGPCKLQDRFSEELIHTVCGILEVNAFESRTMRGLLIRCLYPKLAILSHNCVSNITHSIDYVAFSSPEDYTVTVRAAIEVKEGEELFSSYTYSLWPTLVRRQYLSASKYFDCKCKRCSDPTELGTHMGTLKCTKCDNGVILSSDPLNSEAPWKCTHCEFTTSGNAVQRVFAAIQADIDGVEGMDQDASAIEAREQMERKYKSVLHPRNAYHLVIQMALSRMYGKVEGYTLNDLPDILLERKVEMCRRLLETFNVIEPGYTRIRGITLYDLHAPLILLARSSFNAGMFDQSELKKKLQEAVNVLQESVDILTLEQPSTPEGILGQVAQDALEQLTSNLDELVANA